MFRITQNVVGLAAASNALCTRVHGAGRKPNTMNHFMLSNLREVLFVN